MRGGRVTATMENIAIGLVTSVISGVSVWLWQQVKATRQRQRKAAFFGITADSKCLLVMNHNPRLPMTMHHADIQALVEVAMLVRELGAHPLMMPWDQMREGLGDNTEFCIGGPDANGRTRGHLAAYLPGLIVRPYDPDRRDSLALAVGNRQFLRSPDEQEFVAVAKFAPFGGSRPLFLICGQSAVTNWAAVYFLNREYRRLPKTLASQERFCLVLRVTSPTIYGHTMVELEADVTAAAFRGAEAERQPRAPLNRD
jgi:hypothetical protein